MSAGSDLRYARESAGLTQRELALRVRTRQPRVCEAETPGRNPGSRTVDRYLAATGHRYVVVPSRATTAVEAAEAVGESLNDPDRAFREVVQLSDDLVKSDPAVRVALVAAPPASTGDLRYDGLIAGVVEYRLSEDGLPVPGWVHEPSRRAPQEWFVDPTPGTEQLSRDRSPEPFTRRNIYLDASELASV